MPVALALAKLTITYIIKNWPNHSVTLSPETWAKIELYWDLYLLSVLVGFLGIVVFLRRTGARPRPNPNNNNARQQPAATRAPPATPPVAPATAETVPSTAPSAAAASATTAASAEASGAPVTAATQSTGAEGSSDSPGTGSPSSSGGSKVSEDTKGAVTTAPSSEAPSESASQKQEN